MKLFIPLIISLANPIAVLAATSPFQLATPPQVRNDSSGNNLEARVYPNFLPNKFTPWPRRKGGLQTINYCFIDQHARDQLKGVFDAAVNIWMKALGGPASAQTGHSLEFREHTANGQPMFCYLDPRHVIWNQMVPTDSLVIYWHDVPMGMATTAYRIHTDVTVPGRNSMKLASVYSQEYASQFASQYAHELGHVLGLTHEYQRPDRDDHIRYNPRAVAGYREAADAAMAATGLTEDQVVERFANDGVFTRTYWDFGGAFVKIPMEGNPWMHSGYDINSIMHYPGHIGAADFRRTTYDIETNTMLVKSTNLPVRFNHYPSEMDVAFVRQFYPWHG